jgi:N utilization substance protein B
MGKAAERYRSRELLISLLYQWEFDHTLSALSAEHPEMAAQRYDTQYYKVISQEILQRVPDLDAAIMPLLDRDIEAVSKIELAVLRLGCYELLYREEVPFKVCIDQAARLNKQFGSVDGHKYINAILDALAKQHRQLEYAVAQSKG